MYGWKPEGTRPPSHIDFYELETEWDGRYLTNDGQTVKAADARSLAAALERSLDDLPDENPRIDWNAIVEAVKRHSRVLVLTEEPLLNSFAESLAGRISRECFQFLDAPVFTLGAKNLPAGFSQAAGRDGSSLCWAPVSSRLWHSACSIR